MRAILVTELSGPSALAVHEVSEPKPRHPVTGEDGVVIDVSCASVSYPDVLLSRGEYQLKPGLPFIPGAEVCGSVVSSPDHTVCKPGDRVAALTMIGGMAERAVAPAGFTFRLGDELDDAEGAALVGNYHTAWFSLITRGSFRAGERVLVHGGAGGVGTATLQLIKALGGESVAVVSTDEKERVAIAAGADHVVRSDRPWLVEVRESGGVDMVIDPVGGDRVTDSLRALRPTGRLVIVGFTGGSIPEVKVNRLLLNNLDVIGAGYGARAAQDPPLAGQIAGQLDRLIRDGSVRPLIGARFPLERASDAVSLLDARKATGKVVIDVRPSS
jgi:NADPH2:quinone reductase